MLLTIYADDSKLYLRNSTVKYYTDAVWSVHFKDYVLKVCCTCIKYLYNAATIYIQFIKGMEQLQHNLPEGSKSLQAAFNSARKGNCTILNLHE